MAGLTEGRGGPSSASPRSGPAYSPAHTPTTSPRKTNRSPKGMSTAVVHRCQGPQVMVEEKENSALYLDDAGQSRWRWRQHKMPLLSQNSHHVGPSPPPSPSKAAEGYRRRISRYADEFVQLELPVLEKNWANASYKSARLNQGLRLGSLGLYLQDRLGKSSTVYLATSELMERITIPHQFLVLSYNANNPAGSPARRARPSECVIVDLLYKDIFEVVRPSSKFQSTLRSCPPVLVMSPADVERFVSRLCGAMRDSFHEAGLSMPPWRRPETLINYWQRVSLREFDADAFLDDLRQTHPELSS